MKRQINIHFLFPFFMAAVEEEKLGKKDPFFLFFHSQLSANGKLINIQLYGESLIYEK